MTNIETKEHLQVQGLVGSKYAQDKSALMAIINEIRSTGVSAEIELPTIVVAGNQSSGKSSLIEAISSITLPRAVGTCTRVPIEVRLKQDIGPWNCIVKIRAEGDKGAEANNPEVQFGPVVTEKKLLEAHIRRAQLAILNPSVEPQRFVDYVVPAEEEKLPLGSRQQLGFSRDVVVLEITGPDVTDLTLVDLPGIIHNVDEGEAEGNIELVSDMVDSYINKKDCLILLVITMKDDMKNQSAARKAKLADDSGSRTIGVLTKADTVTGHEDMQEWLKVVRNEKAPLKHKYFVTRQPDADVLAAGFTFKEARAAEDRFFAETTPWTGLNQDCQRRLGTKKLSNFLSNRLSAFINQKLPDIETSIIARHSQVTEELRALGTGPPLEPVGTMLTLLNGFEQKIHRHIEGVTGHERFMQAIAEIDRGFKKRIGTTKPKFVARLHGGKVNIQADDAERSAGEPETMATVYSDSEDEDEDVEMSDAVDPQLGVDDFETKTTIEKADKDGRGVLDLEDIRQHIKECRARDLDNELPQSASRQLFKRSVASWEKLSIEMLDKVRPKVEELVRRLIESHFGMYRHGGLPVSVSAIANEQIQVLYNDTMGYIQAIVDMEHRPFTMNSHYLHDSHAKSLARLKAVPEADPEADTWAIKTLSPLEVLFEKYPTELDLMARTQAYWKVGYKRIIDNIPRIIDLKFLTPLAPTISAALFRELAVFGDNGKARCEAYLGEAPAEAEQRRSLSARLTKLENAKSSIRDFKLK